MRRVEFTRIMASKHDNSRNQDRRRVVGVGRGAIALAHEVRNSLLAMRASLDRLNHLVSGLRGADAAVGEEGLRLIDVCRTEADRCAVMIDRRVREATDRPRKAPCAIGDLLEDALRPMASLLGSRTVRVEVDPAEQAAIVNVDRAQMHSVLTNVVKNAAEAMPGGGLVQIAVDRDDREVRVTMTDSGTGIDPRIRDHIFSPFVTTRGEEGGMGLGLALCKQVLADHGGDIELQPAPGGGTRAILTLPVALGGQSSPKDRERRPRRARSGAGR